jgi:hypothetical protein
MLPQLLQRALRPVAHYRAALSPSPRFTQLTRQVHQESTTYSRANFGDHFFSSAVKGLCARFWRF